MRAFSLGPLPSMSLMTGALAVYTDILKTRHVHFYDTIYCDGQATRFPQEGRLAVRVTAAPAGVERICLEVFGKRCVARPPFQKGGGVTATGRGRGFAGVSGLGWSNTTPVARWRATSLAMSYSPPLSPISTSTLSLLLYSSSFL